MYDKFSSLKYLKIKIIISDVSHLVSVHGSINSGIYILVDHVGLIRNMELRGIRTLDLRISNMRIVCALAVVTKRRVINKSLIVELGHMNAYREMNAWRS